MICISGQWIQPPHIFEGNIGQQADTGLISKIVNYNPIDLKFEEELHIWSLNSTSVYFWSTYTKTSTSAKCQEVWWDFENPQFSSDWLEIWRGIAYLVTELNQPIIFEVIRDQKINIVPRSTTKVVFLNSSIFLRLAWNMKRIYISGQWIQPVNYFGGPHWPKGQHRPHF